MLTTPNQPHASWNFVALVGAWLFPGLGHWLIGDRARGSILCVTILVIWTAGFLIGGISTFDHNDHRWWFVGQSLTAPSVAANLAFQKISAGENGRQPLPPTPDRPSYQPAYEPSFGKTNEQGILYTTLAGLLNLLTMIDVLHRSPVKRGEDARSPADAAVKGSAA